MHSFNAYFTEPSKATLARVRCNEIHVHYGIYKMICCRFLLHDFSGTGTNMIVPVSVKQAKGCDGWIDCKPSGTLIMCMTDYMYLLFILICVFLNKCFSKPELWTHTSHCLSQWKIFWLHTHEKHYARSGYQGQKQVITSHSICGMQFLVLALTTCFWRNTPDYEPCGCINTQICCNNWPIIRCWYFLTPT